uniref:EF-hand domain-containing protein n=1 Tax=Ciona savignyi TaxID=51511 RepID=H2ZCF9_CIOSA
KEAYYRQIFEKLDVDKDGRVDVRELKEAYTNMGLLQVPGQAEKFVSASDSNKDGELDVAEFVRYLHEHEMKLKLMFKRLDSDKDGRLTSNEIEEALRSVGFDVSKEEAKQITRRIDKDGTSTIDINEWVEHHLLHPSADLKDIVSYWKHATVHATKSNNLGIASGFKQMLHEGGAKSLWRGNGINVIKIAPETAVKFYAYEQMKRLIGAQSQGEIGAAEKFLAGSSAGVISQTTIYPMEVIKTRLALRRTGQYSGIFDCAYKLLVNEGPKAFFKGYVPNCIGIIPYAGIDLCIYEVSM